MVSSPFTILLRVKLVASIGDKIRISNPAVSWFNKYKVTFLIISKSWALFSSNQKTAGVFDALALFTASFTQSCIGKSFVWHILQISPCSTECSIIVLPFTSNTITFPAVVISNVLSWEPYSSAFCAIKPTLGTVPMVVGSKAPFFLQKSIVAL